MGSYDVALYGQMSTEGPMARCAEDLALLLSIQAGFDARSPSSLPVSGDIFKNPLNRDSFNGVKVAWMGDYNGYLAMDAGLLDLTHDSLQYLSRLGCEVIPAVPNFDMAVLWQCWKTIRSFQIAGDMSVFYDNPEQRALLKPEIIWEVEEGLALTIRDLHKASEIRCAWIDEVLKMFETYEFLVLPSTQVWL